jgi:hypothetical protein
VDQWSPEEESRRGAAAFYAEQEREGGNEGRPQHDRGEGVRAMANGVRLALSGGVTPTRTWQRRGAEDRRATDMWARDRSGTVHWLVGQHAEWREGRG